MRGLAFAVASSVAAVACSLALSEGEFAGGSGGDASPEASADSEAGPIPDSSGTNPDSGDASTTGVVRGLVSRWRFDESSGATVLDSAGRNDGTLVAGSAGPPTRTTGMLGGALSFAPVSYVSVPAHPSLDVGGAFTITFWLNLSASSPGDPRIFVHGESFYVKFNSAKAQLTMNDVYAISTYSAPAGQWHHFAVAFASATGAAWYVDGLPTANGTNTFVGGETAVVDQQPILFGTDPTKSATASLLGSLDDVRFYGVTLDAAEVAAIAAER